MRQDSSLASAGALNHPLSTSVAEQHLRSLLHSACPALAPLVSLPSSSGSAGADFFPLLLQEVTALTVWHMWQFWFLQLFSSLPLLPFCLPNHSNALLLWQNRGLRRFNIFFYFFFNLLFKFFLLGMRKFGGHFCSEEAEKAQAVKHW